MPNKDEGSDDGREELVDQVDSGVGEQEAQLCHHLYTDVMIGEYYKCYKNALLTLCVLNEFFNF